MSDLPADVVDLIGRLQYEEEAEFPVDRQEAFGQQADIKTKVAGTCVNLASINATVAFPQRAAYCAAKAGVRMLTEVLAIAECKSAK